MSKQRRERQAAQRRNYALTPGDPDALHELGIAAAPKPSPMQPAGGPAQIRLSNPVQDHFRAFIFGNAQVCDHVVEENSAKGQTLVLCGAGPSLADHAAEYCAGADHLWGCNSALPWLIAQGYAPTHGITVDQTPDMCKEWITAPDVEYLVASTVNPNLVEYLLAKERRLRFFHNFVGVRERPVSWKDDDGVDRVMAYEEWLYSTLFPGTIRAGSGLNTVTRAIDVALYMGFAKIIVLGADCALRVKSRPPKVPPTDPAYQRWLKEDTMMHADGGNALASNATPLTMGAVIDADTEDDTVRDGHGRYWETKVDLMISALWLLQLERKSTGRVTIVGDTLVAALRKKNKAYLSRLPTLVDSAGAPIEIIIPD